jgi:fructose-bisphosphate aldolase class II
MKAKSRRFLGVDGGSVTTKIVVSDRDGDIMFEDYIRNEGGPIWAIQQGFKTLWEQGRLDGVDMVGATGSGRELARAIIGADIVKNEIEATGFRAAIHVDHGNDFEVIKRAIDAGWTSVMFDGSKYDFDENVHLTQQVVKYAHKHGVCVEAEVGVIGREEGGMISGKAIYSDPEEVKKFVDMTGIDSVAVSIGNEHGAPTGEKIKIDLLAKIADLVHIPLVLHGSSGLSDGDIRSSIAHGVAKINIDTNIRKAFVHEIETSEAADYRDVMKEGMEEVEKVVEKYIRLFNEISQE